MQATFFSTSVAPLITCNVPVLSEQPLVARLTDLFWSKFNTESQASRWTFVEVTVRPEVTEVFVRIPNQYTSDQGSRYFYKVASVEDALELIGKISSFTGKTGIYAKSILLWLADAQQCRNIMSEGYLRILVSHFLGLTDGEGSFLPDDTWDKLRKAAGLMS